MNIPLLRRVQQQILDEPASFQMEHWFRRQDCGTACCIAGTGIAMVEGTREFKRLVASVRFPATGEFLGGFANSVICDRGARVFEISHDAADRLFYSSHWPQPFMDDWNKHYADAKVGAEVASARIDFFIATNGSDVLTPAVQPEMETADAVRV